MEGEEYPEQFIRKGGEGEEKGWGNEMEAERCHRRWHSRTHATRTKAVGTVEDVEGGTAISMD